jgi:hypothetical protein
MNALKTAADTWTELDGIKRPLMSRVERYAALTIPKVCLPLGWQPEAGDQSHDWQSLGAQAVNHVVNKLMIAMFAPSKPFFRVQEGKKTKAEAAKANIPETQIGTILAKMERDASRELDARAQRPKLYQACRHLVVTGNVLLILGKDSMRVLGLRYFCVKRTAEGKLHKLVVKETVRFDELDPEIQALMPSRYSPETKVAHYKLICREVSGQYRMTQWIEDKLLPPAWNARWSEDRLPYQVLTWDLADEADYGTGLVEDYSGDFEALSVLAEAVVSGAVAGTEFRWVANPNGVTSVDDMRDSANGDVIAGSAKDIGAISPPVADGIKMADMVEQKYSQRISRGFLLSSAVTRNAERVTAEEIRATAMELEASFGGVYSSLAPSLQKPIALWLLNVAGTSLSRTDLSVTIITGLDALSRNGDLENLKQGLATLAELTNVPEPLQVRIKWQDLADFIGQGVGIDLKRFVKDDATVAQEQQAQAAQETQNQQAVDTNAAQAKAAADPQQP